jgi:hypothetical protein
MWISAKCLLHVENKLSSLGIKVENEDEELYTDFCFHSDTIEAFHRIKTEDGEDIPNEISLFLTSGLNVVLLIDYDELLNILKSCQ